MNNGLGGNNGTEGCTADKADNYKRSELTDGDERVCEGVM